MRVGCESVVASLISRCASVDYLTVGLEPVLGLLEEGGCALVFGSVREYRQLCERLAVHARRSRSSWPHIPPHAGPDPAAASAAPAPRPPPPPKRGGPSCATDPGARAPRRTLEPPRGAAGWSGRTPCPAAGRRAGARAVAGGGGGGGYGEQGGSTSARRASFHETKCTRRTLSIGGSDQSRAVLALSRARAAIRPRMAQLVDPAPRASACLIHQSEQAATIPAALACAKQLSRQRRMSAASMR